MNRKEERRKRLEREIFKTCKKESRKPDIAEIAILSNIEDQRLFDKLMPNLDKIIEKSVKNDNKDINSTTIVFQGI